MFGLPTEVIVTLATTVGTWWMENQARKDAAREKQFERLISATKAETESMNAAMKRTPTWLRAILALGVMGVVFGGIAYFATQTDIPVNLVTEIPQKNFFGLFTWGNTLKAYELNGFVLSPMVTNSVAVIMGFTFGRTLGRGGRNG